MAFAHTKPSAGLSEGAFRSAFQLAPAPLALVAQDSPSPRVVAANDAFLEVLQIASGAAQGLAVDQLFRATAAVQVKRAIDHALSDGEPVQLRVVHARSGSLVRLEIDVRRVTLDHDCYVILGARIPDRWLTLAELGEAGVLAELGALSRGLVYIHDVPRRRFRYAAHPLAAKLGLPASPLDLPHVRSMLHPADLTQFGAYVADQASAPDDRVSKGTFRVRGADGEWLWINIRSRVFARDSSGAIHRVIGVATDVSDAHNHAAALAQAASALAHAEVNERRRIGRELHDSTSQLLVGARLALGSLAGHAVLDAKSLEILDEVRQAVASAEQEISNFSYVLHPPSLQEEGLERTLRTFCAGFGRRSGLTVSVNVARGMERLPFTTEIALFRVAQEALMNVYRHAQARKAFVRLKAGGGRVVLEVEDDGIGLPATGEPGKPRGVGIGGMQARMTQIGGAFDLLPGAVGLKVRASVVADSRPEL